MVEKYIILADSKNTSPFETPRQLTIINGEALIERTIKLLKVNGVKDILVTSHDKRFDNLGAVRYEPLHNEYNAIKGTGYWLNAFPIELLNEPVCFLFGDVYYSEDAIKTIVKTKTKATLFFCSFENKSDLYIKHHDEPLAYKVVDTKLFKKHIELVKKLKDENKCVREPIVWELYRSINNQDINIHKMTKNYIAINDISCDIDKIEDIERLLIKLGGVEMIKVEVIEPFTLGRFDELENIERASVETPGKLNMGDKFECTKDIADYLLGDNPIKRPVVKVIEVIPAKELPKEEPKEEIKVEKPKKKKKSTK